MSGHRQMAAGAFILVMIASIDAGAQELNVRLMEATFRIAGPAGANETYSVGTVFFIGRKHPGAPGVAEPVMVTAAHVLQDISGDEAVLWLRKKKADGSYEPLEHRIRIRSRGVPLWTAHGTVDVAVMPLLLPPAAHVPLLPEDLLATDQTIARHGIHPGDELLCLGFPLGLAANDIGFPILRSGKIASYPLIPAVKHPSFLFDFQVYEGNSGGPVYFTAPSRTGRPASPAVQFIAGLVSSHAMVGGQRLQLAAVVPAQFIRELIDRLPAGPAAN